MDQPLPNTASKQVPPITNSLQEGPHILMSEKSKLGYFTRLFGGRMNRQNYILGSIIFVLVPLLCFLVIIFNILLSPSAFAMPYLNPNNPSELITPQVSIPSLLETPQNEIWAAIGILFFILSIPYLFSLQIKRLHDLNLTGWLWILNFLPLLFIKNMFSFTEFSKPDIWLLISYFVSLVSSIFSIYVSLWPGTRESNKYGEPPLPRNSLLEDIFAIK